MIQAIVIVSGKRDAGKTSLAASFTALANHPVMADCHVDAAMPSARLSLDISEARARKLTGTSSFPIGEKLFLRRIPKDEIKRLLPEAP